MAIWAATAGKSGHVQGLSRRVKQTVALMAATWLVVLLAFLAFLAGEHQQRPFTVLKGVATVGYHVATVIVAGWAYGIQGDGIPWVDQEGTTHLGSWPACLGGPGRTVPVTFGEIPVSAPGAGTWRQVVWVDCRS